MDEKRDRWTDSAIAVVVLGLAFGAHSLSYPYGRDQSLFHYIGREWLVHGAIPYRDTFDLKPPLIYLIYGLCVRVFGDVMWGIRLAEWALLVPLAGALTASLASPAQPGERTSKWRIALGIFGANVIYFGFFGFWDTGQCEIWCAVACLAALWIILRTTLAPRWMALTSGLLAGFAFLMKPPAALMVLVIAAALVAKHGAHRRGDRDAKKRAGIALVVFGVSALAVIVVTILYFVQAGAFADMFDVVVNYNRAYVKGDRDQSDWIGWIERVGFDHYFFDPWATVAHALIVLGLVRGGLDGKDKEARPRWLLAAALVATAALGVFVQAKFYRYHWGLMLAGELLALLLVLGDVERMLPAWRARRAALVAAVLVVFTLCVAHTRRWLECNYWALAWKTGAKDRMWFTDQYRQGWITYYFKDREQIGEWVRDHSSPDDRLLVRGFEPSIYVSAHRSYGGRFATTHHLNSPKVVYRREEWRAQDRADILRIKPRFVVALEARPDMPGWPVPAEIDDAKWFEQFGYHDVHHGYGFVVMERAP